MEHWLEKGLHQTSWIPCFSIWLNIHSQGRGIPWESTRCVNAAQYGWIFITLEPIQWSNLSGYGSEHWLLVSDNDPWKHFWLSCTPSVQKLNMACCLDWTCKARTFHSWQREPWSKFWFLMQVTFWLVELTGQLSHRLLLEAARQNWQNNGALSFAGTRLFGVWRLARLPS